MSVVPGREDDAYPPDKTLQGVPTWQQRAAARDHSGGTAKTAAMPPVPLPPMPPQRPALPPPAAPLPLPPEPTLRVHIEEIPATTGRPELLSTPPGRTVFDAVGPREVVATALKAMAHTFDPPWWMFWAHRRRR